MFFAKDLKLASMAFYQGRFSVSPHSRSADTSSHDRAITVRTRAVAMRSPIRRQQRDASMDEFERKLLETMANARYRDKLRRRFAGSGVGAGQAKCV